MHALTRQLYTLRMRVGPLAKSAATARVMAASGMSLQSWSTPWSSLRGGPACHVRTPYLLGAWPFMMQALKVMARSYIMCYQQQHMCTSEVVT